MNYVLRRTPNMLFQQLRTASGASTVSNPLNKNTQSEADRAAKLTKAILEQNNKVICYKALSERKIKNNEIKRKPVNFGMV